jgi:hypothetical protein
MRIVTVIFAILLMVSVVPRTFGQWELSSYINGVAPTGFNEKVTMSFVSPDTGYIAYDIYENDTSYYFRTVDSGKSWVLFDTTLNYNINDLEYKYGWGLSCGSTGNGAAVELINTNMDSRDWHTIDSYIDISQINIVDSTHAVFLGINKDTSYTIGLFEKRDEQVQIVNQTVITKAKIRRIDFFSDSMGYFWINKSLYITYDLGQTKKAIGSNVGSFDFYSLDTGIYINYNSNLLKTSDRGDTWDTVRRYVGIDLDVVSLMNSSKSLYYGNL